MKYKSKLDIDLGVLECYVYAIKYSDLTKADTDKERYESLGLPVPSDDEEDIIGEAKKILIDLSLIGGISYFHEDEVRLSEDETTNATLVQFKDGLQFVLIISFNDFKDLYYTYKKPNTGK